MKSRGFTLIELLVALVVLALMAPLLASGLRLGLRAWDEAAKDAHWTVPALESYMALMRQHLE